MKRIIPFAFLLLPFAFLSAEVAPTPSYYYDEVTGIEYMVDPITGEFFEIVEEDVGADNILSEESTPVATKPTTVAKTPTVNPRTASVSRATTRVVPAAVTLRNNSVSATTSRAVPNRTVSARTNTTTRTSNRTTTGRTAVNVTSPRVVPQTTVARAGLVQTDTVNTPLYTGRGVGTRAPSAIRTSTDGTSTAATTSTSATTALTSAQLDELTKLTDLCRTQFTECMDNYCNVLDDNQGRCSCSANLTNYADSEESLKNATLELQNVARQIQYLGLTRDEVISLYTATEAEQAMQNRVDNTTLKREIDNVLNMIVEPTGNTNTNASAFGFDLSGLLQFSFDDSGFNLSSFFGNTAAGSASISNQRGTELFNTATARCRQTVLDSCRANGVDTTLITNKYDLEIDKQCILYERELTDATTQMRRTGLNAKNVLEKARLLVAQEKNQYDLRGCVTALDDCMQDDYVCGDDYENCLDPTGKYISAGAVIPGSEPGKIGDVTASIYNVWKYSSNNAWATNGNLGDFINQYITSDNPVATNMVGFLQQKIGYNDKGRNYGMCISVLNKCQALTYKTETNTYERNNKVVENYLQRTLALIKAAQDEVLAEYGQNCVSNVLSCLAMNGWDDKQNSTSVKNTAAKNACNSIIKTCDSITGGDSVAAAIGDS